MLNRIIKYTFPFILLLGTLLIAFGIANIEGATVITQDSISYGTYTWNYYKIDFNLYLRNLENSLKTDLLLGIIPTQPTRANMPSGVDIVKWLKFIANSALQYPVNFIIYAINWVILAPLKIILYPLNLIFTILGLNTTDKTYIQALKDIYNWQLPYIPNF